MTSWIIPIAGTHPQHWQIAREHGFWDMTKGDRVHLGDTVYFWQSGGSLLAQCTSKSSYHPIDTSMASPWEDSGEREYVARFTFDCRSDRPTAQPRLPDSRTLLLKDVDERGWAFACTASLRKAQQIAANPAAALSLWWQPQMRAVHVRGPVVTATPQECEADLAARSPQARATVPPGEWRVWRVQPQRIEYWQGSSDRQHIRIVYTRDGDGWSRTVDRGENAR